MIVRKYRWSRDYESAEEELRHFLESRQYQTTRWEATTHSVFAAHEHTYHKKLWCAEGSIQFSVGDKRYSLQSGDALDLPAGTMHTAVAGACSTRSRRRARSSSSPPT